MLGSTVFFESAGFSQSMGAWELHSPSSNPHRTYLRLPADLLWRACRARIRSSHCPVEPACPPHAHPESLLADGQVNRPIVNGIVVNCEYMRRHVTDDEHFPSDKVHLCYNGLNISCFSADGGVFPPRKGGGDTVTVGSVSVLRPEKNLRLLLHAFARLTPETPYARLILVGSGPEHGNLESLARELVIATGACSSQHNGMSRFGCERWIFSSSPQFRRHCLTH